MPGRGEASSNRELAAHLRLPLRFEANHGQTDPRVKFLARGQGYTLFLTPSEAVLVLGGGKTFSPRRPRALPTRAEQADPATVLRLTLEGANPAPSIAGRGVMPGKSHYFIGNDPRTWHRNVSAYASVEYQEVYPGVTLVYYGTQRQLEYDFLLAPGADPAAIVLAFQGQSKLEVDGEGDLVLHTAHGAIRQHRPRVYQEANGTRQGVPARYVRKGPHQVGFQVAAYDPSRPLVIDPVLSYATYFGGSSGDDGAAIALDRSGNVYVLGNTGSTDLPTASPFQPTPAGDTDIFVAKLTPDGSTLIYSTYLGGTGNDTAWSIAVDDAGHAYVSGFTDSTDFPTTPHAVQPANGGGFDAFLAKLSRDGSALRYSTYLGGSADDFGTGLAVDRHGRAYLTGSTASTDFPTTPGVVQPAFAGCTACDLGGDAFVAKLNRRGSALIYSTYLGGSDGEFPTSLAVDKDGHALVTGSTNSPDFPTTPEAVQPGFGGGSFDAFVAKLSRDGSGLRFSTYLDGSDDDFGAWIAVDRHGRAHVTGSTVSTDFPTTPGALQRTNRGLSDAFVTKFNRTGSRLRYATYLGGGADDFPLGIAVDRHGKAHVTGLTASADFPVAHPTQPALGGGFDAFVATLNSAGSRLRFSTYLGGSDDDVGVGIAVDRRGRTHVTGFTNSADFPTSHPIQPTLGGPLDAFIAAIAPAKKHARHDEDDD